MEKNTMFIEEYAKRAGGKTYYTAYYRFGQVLVSVQDIKAGSKEEAKAVAIKYLKKAQEL